MFMYADIEECEQLKPCSHGCVNIVGSFRCSCPSGMSLSGDGRVCKGTFYVLLLLWHTHILINFTNLEKCGKMLQPSGTENLKSLNATDIRRLLLGY